MAESTTGSSRSGFWAWAVGLLFGLAIGIPSFGPKGGVAFGVATAVVVGLTFGATRRRVDDSADGQPAGASTPAQDV
ncbi:hypothetical protein ACQPZK_04825 [Micromonospora sp. CA-249363]|jgi:hypothetical protein|uniref:hypothetical protein n=1 Tax=Micromonospora sp. CA-249363 TaxID=3239963 RepID=UPI003D8AEB59